MYKLCKEAIRSYQGCAINYFIAMYCNKYPAVKKKSLTCRKLAVFARFLLTKVAGQKASFLRTIKASLTKNNPGQYTIKISKLINYSKFRNYN